MDFVIPQSPADEAGLKEGDRISAIDGKPARELPLWEIRRMLQQEGREVNLRIERPAGTRTVKLKMRELLGRNP